MASLGTAPLSVTADTCLGEIIQGSVPVIPFFFLAKDNCLHVVAGALE